MVHRFRRIHGVIAALLLPLVLLAVPTTVPAQDSIDDLSIEQLFQRGLAAFDEGNYSATNGALYYFNPIRARIGSIEDPREEAELVQRLIALANANERALLSMSRSGNMDNPDAARVAGFVDWLNETNFRTGVQPSPNADVVADAVDDVLDGQAEVRSLLQYGAHVVPALVERGALQGVVSEDRVRVNDILVRMGHRVVLPLIQMLESTIPSEQISAATALGNIGDDRAVAGLVALVARAEADGDVQRAALNALRSETMLGTISTTADLPSAVELYYSLALEYYRGRPSVINSLSGSGFTLWDYERRRTTRGTDRGTLVGLQVPQWAFRMANAEQACLDGLRALNDARSMNSMASNDEANGQQLWDLFASVTLDQYLASKRRLSMDSTSADARALIDQYQRGHLVASAAGQNALFRAIDRSLNNQHYGVAIAAMHIIADMGSTIDLPTDADFTDGNPTSSKPSNALIRALTFAAYKPVRFAAAQTLFTLSKRYSGSADDFYLMDAARDVLIEGIGVSEQRSILVVTGNLDLTNDMRAKLLRLGYNAQFEPTASRGYAAATSSSFDLIIVDENLAQDSINMADATSSRGEARPDIFDALGDDIRTRGTAVFVIVDQEARANPRSIQADPSFSPYFTAGLIDGVLGVANNEMPALVAEVAQFDAVWENAAQYDDSADDIAIRSAHALQGWNFDQMTNASFFRPVVPALLERITSDSQTQVKLAMLATLRDMVRSRNAQAFPTGDFIAEDNTAGPVLVDTLHNVLHGSTANFAPSVKEHACIVLTELYRSRRDASGDQRWSVDTGADEEMRGTPENSIFEAALALLSYNLLDGEEVNVDSTTRNDVAGNMHMQVLAVRAAAGELLGAAPISEAQRFIVIQTASPSVNGSRD